MLKSDTSQTYIQKVNKLEERCSNQIPLRRTYRKSISWRNDAQIQIPLRRTYRKSISENM